MAEPTPSRDPHGLLYLGHPDDARYPGHELDERVAPPPTRALLIALTIAGAVAAFAGLHFHHLAAGAAVPVVHAAWIAPFAALLGAIALMPFVAPHWWEHHYAKVACALGAIVATYYLVAVSGGGRAMAGSVAEYVSFILLLGSLYVVSGGILIRVRGRATPAANTLLLAIGAILANALGTTGASMVLIRPFLRLNGGHVRPYHVVFFIFVVSNCGGALTPIGDPPLFLGFLQGVPFWWVAEHCWPIWLVVNGGLLATFFAVDSRQTSRQPRAAYDAANDPGTAVSLYGGANVALIAVIVAGILLHAPINAAIGHELPVRELAMVLAAVASLAITPRRIHQENQFGYAPIKEVAFLFVGIFLTMVPALNYLYHENAKPEAERRIGLHTPGQFYFACGSLSAVLDNAPTYLTFLQSKLGQLDAATVRRAVAIGKRPGTEVTADDVAGLSDDNAASLRTTIDALKRYHGDRLERGTLSEAEARVGFLVADEKQNLNLVAISMGAVLFGAMTYIGNGPNFMVRSIAQHAGVEMPSFFGYLFRYAVPALLPLLIVVWAIFLR